MLWGYKNCQNIGVSKELSQVRTKNFLAQALSLVLYTSNNYSNFLENSLLDSKMLLLSRNYQEVKTNVFQSQIFELNQICKECLHKSTKIGILT